MVKNLKFLFLLFACLNISLAHANEIIIGPYIQLLKNNEIAIKWETLLPAPSILEYTTDNQNFYTFEDAIPKNEHSAILVEPVENLTYNYHIFDRVANKDYEIIKNQAKKFDFSLKIRPKDDPELLVWVLGDPGVSGDPQLSKKLHRTQKKVKKQFFKYLEKEKLGDIDYIVSLGDNAYPRGTWQEFKDGFFTPYADILGSYGVYSVFGNHDQGQDKREIGIVSSARSYPEPYGTYYDFFDLPLDRAFYSLDEKDAHLVFLDTSDSYWEDFDGSNYEEAWTHNSIYKNKMLDWLEKDLKNNTKQWTVVFFHHPPFGQSEHPNEKSCDIWKAWTNAYIVPLLHKYEVDLVLTGHIHNYQRTFPLKIKRKDLDRSQMPARSDFIEEKRLFCEKNIALLDKLKLPHYEPIKSSNSLVLYSKEDDPIYVIMGSSGAAFKEIPRMPNKIFFRRKERAGSGLLKVTNSRLEFRFIDKSGDVLDQVVITKDRPLVR